MTQETVKPEPEPEEAQMPVVREMPEEERPLFDLGDLLKARMKKGETPSFIEALMFMQYLDNKEERLWRRQQAEMERSTRHSNPTPEVEALKAEVSELRKTVTELLETVRNQQQQEAQKAFVEGVVKQTTDKIMPELEFVKQKLAEYDEKIATGQKPETTLTELKETLKEAIDKLGERVGSSGKTISDYVSDVEKIMSLVDAVEKRMKRPEGGEVDYKTMAVSTLGEIGKELVSTYRDVSTSKVAAGAYAPPQPETPASAMQNIIKRQVQNYILNRMQAGATTMNVQQAAQELGLTPGQVTWAYQQLMKEGWFHVQVGKKTKVKESVEKAEEGFETKTESAGEQAGEQVFEPPSA